MDLNNLHKGSPLSTHITLVPIIMGSFASVMSLIGLFISNDPKAIQSFYILSFGLGEIAIIAVFVLYSLRNGIILFHRNNAKEVDETKETRRP